MKTRIYKSKIVWKYTKVFIGKIQLSLYSPRFMIDVVIFKYVFRQFFENNTKQDKIK